MSDSVVKSGLKGGKASKSGGGIPLSVRFKAWWEGIDPEALKRGGGGAGASMPADELSKIHVEEGETFDPTSWSDERIEFCKRLWGIDEKDEMVSPGGSEYTRKLFKPMPLDESKSALDLSAGLGGGIRSLAKEEGLWITGMEEDQDLARKADHLSTVHGLTKKAPISFFEPRFFELPPSKFDGALVRERIYRHSNKERTLEQVTQSLRPNGHLVITDYILPNSDAHHAKPVLTWMAKEGNHEIWPWILDDYERNLANLGYDVRISEDETDKYRTMVLNGWQNFVDSLSRSDLTRNLVDNMMPEAESWLLLLRALESGALRYHRFHAIKRH